MRWRRESIPPRLHPHPLQSPAPPGLTMAAGLVHPVPPPTCGGGGGEERNTHCAQCTEVHKHTCTKYAHNVRAIVNVQVCMLTIALTCSYAHHHNHRCCAHMHAQLHRHLYMFTFTIAHIGHICTHTIADIVCAHPPSQLPSVHTYTHTHTFADKLCTSACIQLQTYCAHLHTHSCRYTRRLQVLEPGE